MFRTSSRFESRIKEKNPCLFRGFLAFSPKEPKNDLDMVFFCLQLEASFLTVELLAYSCVWELFAELFYLQWESAFNKHLSRL